MAISNLLARAFLAGSFVLAVCDAAQLLADDFPNVPGQVLFHGPITISSLVASPSIAIMPNGDYYVKAEWNGRTYVFRSKDRGYSWQKLRTAAATDKDIMKWGNLFVHRGQLYLLGTRMPRGDIMIRSYDPESDTWTQVQGKTGRLLHPDHDQYPPDNGYHTAPVSMLVHKGRIWRAYERFEAGDWGGFNVLAMSAPVDADLLDPKSWTFTNEIERDSTWHNGQFFSWLEGNVVVDRDGNLVDILRVDLRNKSGSKPCGKAAIVNIENENTVSFDPSTGFIEFPGGQKKFTIWHDPQSDRYWSITNFVPQQFRREQVDAEGFRGMASLISSPDLREWQVEQVAVADRRLLSADPAIAETGLEVGKRGFLVTKSGFQYADFRFDGDDIAFVSRTAYDDGMGGPKGYHSSNFCTFHRIKDFRTPPPHVLLADTGNNRVIRFEATSEGSWYALHNFAGGPAAEVSLDRPIALAQDTRGFVYVAEGRPNGRVLRFDAAGNFLNVVATAGVDFEGRPVQLGPIVEGSLCLSTQLDAGQVKSYRINTWAGVSERRGYVFLDDSLTPPDFGSARSVQLAGATYQSDAATNAVTRTSKDGSKETVVTEGLKEPGQILAVAKPQERRWVATGSGEWSNYYHWHAYWGTPNTAQEIAVFADAAPQGGEIRLDSEVTVAGLRFANPKAFTVDGSGALKLAPSNGPGRLEVFQGQHVVNLPIALDADCEVFVARGARLALNGQVQLQGHRLRHSGGGELTIQKPLDLQGGQFVKDSTAE